MAKQWDFTNQAGKQGTENKTVRLIDGLPLPTGRPVQVKHLTDGEKEVLKVVGLAASEPIPENIAEIAAQIKETEKQEIRAEFEERKRTRKFSMPELESVQNAPSSTQTQMQEQIEQYRSLFGAAQPSPEKPSAEDEEAARLLKQKFDIDMDTLPATERPGSSAPPQSAPDHTSDRSETKGDSSAADRSPLVDISDAVIDRYLDCLCLGELFTHDYSLFGDRLRVVFRTLRVSESYQILLAAQHKSAKLQSAHKDLSALGYTMSVEWAWRYRVAVQLVSIHSKVQEGIHADFPPSLEAWSKYFKTDDPAKLLESVYDAVVVQVIGTDNLFQVINASFAEFQSLCSQLADTRHVDRFFR